MEKKRNGPSKEVSFQLVLEICDECQMTGLLLVVCSMSLARRLQTHDHQSWFLNVESGDRRVLPSGVKNDV